MLLPEINTFNRLAFARNEMALIVRAIGLKVADVKVVNEKIGNHNAGRFNYRLEFKGGTDHYFAKVSLSFDQSGDYKVIQREVTKDYETIDIKEFFESCTATA